MKFRIIAVSLSLGVVGQGVAMAATCTPTGFIRDSINLTAALINPSGTVSGDVDATGCNIGVYYGPKSTGQVNGANIHGANYYGIVNNGGNVAISFSSISDIGERPLNGDQHGVGIYFAFGSASAGKIVGNTLWAHQKGGIVVNGTRNMVEVSNNALLGQGPVNYIAQNGIQTGYGAQTHVHDNFVSGYSYTGGNSAASGGIILVGGDCYGGPLTKGLHVENNKVVGSDVGVWFTNLDMNCNPPSVLTQDLASGNDIVNNEVNNTTGNGPTQGYQAGVSDQGDADVIKTNDVCGPGYTGGISSAAALYTIDVTSTNNVVVSGNTTCSGPDPLVDGSPTILRPSIVQ